MKTPDDTESTIAALMTQGRWAEALQLLGTALRSDPGWTVGWLNLGVCHLRLKQAPEALEALARGLELEPNRPRTRLSLADASLLANLPERALHWCREECRHFPDSAPAWMALGIALERRNDPQAVDAYREGHLRAPDDPDLAAHLGRWLQEHHQLEESLEILSRARERHPRHGRIQWQWTVNCWLRGDLTTGLRALDSRLGAPEFQRHPQLERIPLWGLDSPPRDPIFIEPEQGFGDSLQFLRFVPTLVARGHRVWLGVPKALERLVSKSLQVERILTRPSDAEGAGCRIPIMSLPSRLGIRGEDLVGTPYLSPTTTGSLPQRSSGEPLRVGLVWRGNPGHRNDHRRSIPLRQLHPLLRVDKVEWVSFQTGEAARAEIEAATAEGIPIQEGIRSFEDFEHAAAELRRTHLLVTVDTAMAHLAGALGHPVWTLIPFVPDWRWTLSGQQTAWYRSMRLFRQTRPDSWSEPLGQITEALGNLARVEA